MIQRNGEISHALGLEEYCLKKSNLQVQCNTYQNTHNIFHRTRANNPEIYMEP